MRVTTLEAGGGVTAYTAEPAWVAPAIPDVVDAGRAGRIRVLLIGALFLLIYGVIAGRLIMLGFDDVVPEATWADPEAAIAAARPDLLDRNGEILATDIKTASLYAEPRNIIDVDEAAFAINSVLPDLSVGWLQDRLDGDGGFVWLKREITPRQQEAIHNLGIPGVGFLTENQRFYPGGNVASHLLGAVNVDNQGIAGIEKYIDDNGLAELQQFGFTGQGTSLEPVRLSIDLRVQHILRDELENAMELYQAIAASGIVMDIHTGEVLAMSSLPDFDPNQPEQALDPDRLNRVTAGVYELGSVFKTMTLAMALDSGLVNLLDIFDASHPLRIGGFSIGDFHGKNRPLTAEEVFIYSSNIGAGRIALVVGPEGQQEFYRRMGLMDRVPGELPERALPLMPSSRWGDLTTVTASFGHGFSVTPFHLATATAALMNGGILLQPTFFPRDEATAMALGHRVVSEETSQEMRYLFRLNSTDGSGRRADVEGYLVGGKTGTAEKIVDGAYSGTVRLNSYLAAFPMDDPQYVVLVVVDEPKAGPDGGTTAAYNAAPTVSAVIRRAAPLLGVSPHLVPFDGSTVAAFQL